VTPNYGDIANVNVKEGRFYSEFDDRERREISNCGRPFSTMVPTRLPSLPETMPRPHDTYYEHLASFSRRRIPKINRSLFDINFACRHNSASHPVVSPAIILLYEMLSQTARPIADIRGHHRHIFPP